MIFVLCAAALPARHRAAAIASDAFSNDGFMESLSVESTGMVPDLDGYGAIWAGSQRMIEGKATSTTSSSRWLNTCGQTPAKISCNGRLA